MSENGSELVQAGLRLLKEQDYKAAEETLRRAADAGDPEACRLLASEYRHGFHFSSYPSEREFRYMQLAAEKGSLVDRCLMSLYAASGIESRIPKNRLKAAEWIEPVHDRPEAQAVGSLFGLPGYENNFSNAWDGISNIVQEHEDCPDEPDWLAVSELAAAIICQRISPDHDDARNFMLGCLLSSALRLSELKSKAGYAALGVFLNSDEGEQLDPEYRQEVVGMLEKGAAEDDYDCMYLLGIYLQKHGQPERGRELIRKAAEHEVSGAMCLAAVMDLEEGADPEQILLKLERCIELNEDEALVPAAKLLETRDEAKSLEYIRRAADNGDTEAMLLKGNAYMTGWQVKTDPERAVLCFRDAIAAGDVKAHLALGRALEEGKGVTADPFAAFGHISFAAESSDDPPAWMDLGRMLIEGIGCKPDREKGMQYLHRAVDRDYGPAIYLWCNYCLNDPEKEMEELRRDVLPMMKKAADMGVSPAQIFYGMILLDGIENDPDPEKAAEYFLKASKDGNPEADYWLGFMHLHGIGVKLDEKKAETYFFSALENGHHPKAMLELGKIMLRGKDYISAFRLFSDASELKCAEATLELAAMFEKGLGMPKDSERAKELKELADEQKDED